MDEVGLNISLDRLGLGILKIRDDPELTILSASGAFYEMLGYCEGEIRRLREAGETPVLREANPEDWEALMRRTGDQSYVVVQLKLIRKDGHHIWVSYRATRCSEGGERFFLGLVDNITLVRRFQRIQREQKEELEALTANIPGGVLRFRADENLTLNFVSDGFCRISGYTKQEIAQVFQSRFMEMVFPADRPVLLEQIRDAKTWQNRVVAFMFRVVCKDGSVLWMLNKARCMVDKSGTVWIYSVLIDVTSTKKAQDELKASEERFRLILENATYPVLDCNFSTGEFYFSGPFRKKFSETSLHLKADEILPFLKTTHFVFEEDRPALLDYCRRVMSGKKTEDEDFRFRSGDGTYIWCTVKSTLFCDSAGQPARLIVMFTDIDHKKKETLDLRRKAEHDLLTGLYNSFTATAMVNSAIAHSTENDRHALFVVDIDNFKKINDSFGHLSGDRLIAELASRIRALFRDSDIVGRVGGDEFIVFMEHTDPASVIKKAQTLNRTIAAVQSGTDTAAHISGSVGIAFFPADGKSYDELFRKADTAMYCAKKRGKNSFCVYCQGMTISESTCSCLRREKEAE
jgi:diguanylate cyclase (GGDEF)-like protein/PAS domain S-box-containing protein